MLRAIVPVVRAGKATRRTDEDSWRRTSSPENGTVVALLSLINITPEDVVIKATTEHVHTEDNGKVHRYEFTAGQVFRSLAFPKPVDTAMAKADYQNGMLHITVPVAAEARATRVDVRAA